MRNFTNVRGTQDVVNPLEINVDTVYVRSSIERIETEDFTGWQYDETQYTLHEYIETIANKNAEIASENTTIKASMAELAELVLTGGM